MLGYMALSFSSRRIVNEILEIDDSLTYTKPLIFIIDRRLLFLLARYGCGIFSLGD